MPWGHHVARCICCGTQWVVGDCIPNVCPECSKKGHDGTLDCEKCRSEFLGRQIERAKLSARLAEEARQRGPLCSPPDEPFGVGIDITPSAT